MTFAQAIRTCFSKYATFSGRARRSEYWFWILFTSVVITSLYIVAIIMVVAILRNDPDADVGSGQYDGQFGLIGLIILAFLLVTLLPSLSVLVRRLHDTGRSGALAWLTVVPVVNIIVIVWACEDSHPDNTYGPSPKGPLGANPAFGQYYGPSPFGGPPPPQAYGAQNPGQPYPQPYQPYGGQPQYGQPQYGQPQYGAPQNGQPPYGQPSYGQPQYGQPNGQSPNGQSPNGQSPNGQSPYGQPPYGQPPEGERPPEKGSPDYGPPR